MIKRLLRSRGVGKFRRNKLAMFSLGIIGVFFLGAFWMMAMDALLWIGMKTGAYDLYRVPVMSTFLPKRMLLEVGPPNLSGLGRPWGENGRANNVDFYYTKAKTAVQTIESIPGISPESVQEVLDDASVMERRLIDADYTQISELVDEVSAILGEMDSVRGAMSSAETIEIEVDDVKAAIAAYKNAAESEDSSLLRENIAYAIEDIRYAIDDYQSYSPDSTAFEESIFERLDEFSEAYMDAEGDSPELGDLLRQIRDAAGEAVKEVQGGAMVYVVQAEEVVNRLYPEPTGISGLAFKSRQLLGTDRQGRSILLRTLYSSKIAIQVGVVVGFTAVLFGSILGAAAAFFGGWVDHLVAWLYSTFSSIPQLVLLAVLSFMFLSDALAGFRGLPSLYFAFAMTYWIGPCRVIRGEALKIKELEYVQAATAIGFGRFYILMRHILPNTLHLMFINFSLLFIGAIKGEVILTFLGLGLPLGSGASWGIMISQAKAEVVQGFFWQIGAATFFMFVLVLAFNILSDALQDAFDPKHVN
ncbi:MAG: ABC transporter permease [Phycisphaerales bacterium]|nr:ABC transporter permease [Phycisphaerales bacterium]MCB9836263.1 ABC transporter permease [Phycisphaera sp.]